MATGILIEDGRALMVRHDRLGVYLPPGGHVEPGELPSEAVAREFMEETGLLVRPIGLKRGVNADGVVEEPLPLVVLLETVRYPEEIHIHYDLVFLVERVGGVLREGEWFDVGSIEGAPTFDNVKSVVRLAAKELNLLRRA